MRREFPVAHKTDADETQSDPDIPEKARQRRTVLTGFWIGTTRWPTALSIIPQE